MKKNKGDIFFIVIILLSILATVFIFKDLPTEIPTHWNIKGEVDNYSSKHFAFFTALLPALIYVLMKVVPRINIKRKSYQKYEVAYNATIFSTILFLIGVHWVIIFSALGYSIDIIKYVKVSLGILLVIIGRYMPQIKFNYLFGIRTPWTLLSLNVWRKTHMVGGYLYFVMGTVFILSSLSENTMSLYLALGSLIVLSIGIVIYSYILYRKEKNKTV